jgi:hypothetical protein
MWYVGYRGIIIDGDCTVAELLLPNRRVCSNDDDNESNATVAMVVASVLLRLVLLQQDTGIIADGMVVPPPLAPPSLHRVNVKTIKTVAAAATIVLRLYQQVVVVVVVVVVAAVWAATRGSSTRLVGCGCGSHFCRGGHICLSHVQYLSLSLSLSLSNNKCGRQEKDLCTWYLYTNKRSKGNRIMSKGCSLLD